MTRLSDDQLERIQASLSRLEAELRAEVRALKEARIASLRTRCDVVKGDAVGREPKRKAVQPDAQ